MAKETIKINLNGTQGENIAALLEIVNRYRKDDYLSGKWSDTKQKDIEGFATGKFIVIMEG